MEKFNFDFQRFADTVLTNGDDYYANYTNDVRILALGGNDTIHSFGSNSTIDGGEGNDTLIGGDGVDTFIYNSGEGKDVVLGFSDDDLLKIVGNFTTSVNKTGTEIALKVGKGSLTLKDFTATEFNIGDDTYSISGNKLAK